MPFAGTVMLMALGVLLAALMLAAILAWRRAETARQAALQELNLRNTECRAIRHDHDRLRAVLDASPVPICYVDRNLNVQAGNSRCAEWRGIALEDLEGCPLDTLLPNPLMEAVRARLGSVFTGHSVRMDSPCPGDLAEYMVAVTMTPHRDTDGAVTGFSMTFEDMSELQRVESELRHHRATARAILDAAVDGVVTIDENGIIEDFNRAAEAIFGYQDWEVVGKNVSILMPEPYRSAHDDYIRHYLATGEARIIGSGREVRGRRRDGTTFPMDLAVGESRVGGRRLFAGIVRDITERKRTEDRLRSSEERFRLLVEGVTDYAITVLDTQGHITSWNVGAERLYGWQAGDILGRHFSCFYPEDAMKAGEPARTLSIVQQFGRFEEEGFRLRKDGNCFWAHVALSPLRDESGRLRAYVQVARDMTQHKRAEEDLRRAKEEAERANLAKSHFLAAASHDLRQPVQALVFFTSALSLKISDPQARSVLADLERSVEALNMLLDSLLDISRLDAGLVTPKYTDFSISTVIERMEADFRPAAQDRGLEFRVVPSSMIVRSDPALLSRIVQNLVANAVRYTQRGRILVGCRRRGKVLSIEVWDTGIGIENSRLDEIFEEFTQIGNPERDRSQGLGLGLAIVKRLANLMGHKIEVRSVPGRGSVFSIQVGLGETRSQANPMRGLLGQTPAVPDAKELVVIIDDEATILKGLRLVLESWGYEVLAASSEDEALALLAGLDRRPSAILADYRLREGRTGTQAIRHIRDLFHAPIPSIIITGDTAPERLREAEASGLRILHKPIQPPELHLLLNQTLRTNNNTVH
ncbi:PAS domain S-box protein [Telmatospirillum sp. J64-1]|uniref:PAS domain S-box protein n=1 Tax=Telmatospirillum sp. J64-1 TaxID=2502183 RepID=UPI00115DC0CF|nr:PAS domain S-box protein [Telmatospirillum sp. J64-1]